MVKNNDLRRLVDSQREKNLAQCRTILELKKENDKFKKKLALMHSFKSSFWKKKLEVREKTIKF